MYGKKDLRKRGAEKSWKSYTQKRRTKGLVNHVLEMDDT